MICVTQVSHGPSVRSCDTQARMHTRKWRVIFRLPRWVVFVCLFGSCQHLVAINVSLCALPPVSVSSHALPTCCCKCIIMPITSRKCAHTYITHLLWFSCTGMMYSFKKQQNKINLSRFLNYELSSLKSEETAQTVT